MENLKALLKRVSDSANAAQAHYQIWFALRGEGKALPSYYDVMNDYRYVDFFHAINSGNYKLMYIELGCLFDSDSRSASIRNLKIELENSGLNNLVEKINITLSKYSELVSKIITIRSKLIAHKEIGVTSTELHAKHGIIPDKIGELIKDCCFLINEIHDEITGENSLIAGVTDRFDRATFGLLEVLKNGRS
jgi:hypothetical protein